MKKNIFNVKQYNYLCTEVKFYVFGKNKLGPFKYINNEILIIIILINTFKLI